jgi:alkanesulfonate monooxygenase SsuD/methylene tetrahydromethanopterin reductase-like flavin-dependent oxidoreductase (luciferase family)
MKVGISLTSNHPEAKDPRQGSRWMIKRAAAAHRAGLDSLFVGEMSSEAQAVLQHALSQGYRGMPAEALIAGLVDEVAEQFQRFEELGYTDILVRHLTNHQPKVLGSLDRLAVVRGAALEAL